MTTFNFELASKVTLRRRYHSSGLFLFCLRTHHVEPSQPLHGAENRGENNRALVAQFVPCRHSPTHSVSTPPFLYCKIGRCKYRTLTATGARAELARSLKGPGSLQVRACCLHFIHICKTRATWLPVKRSDRGWCQPPIPYHQGPAPAAKSSRDAVTSTDPSFPRHRCGYLCTPSEVPPLA